MKLAIATAFAVLALASTGLAQPLSDHASGVPGEPRPQPAISPPVSHAALVQIHGASQQMNLACAADAKTLCGDKTPRGLNRCLDYHRLRLSQPCRNAMEQLRLALNEVR